MKKTHHNLDAWKTSLELVTIIYDLTKELPSEEQYVLTPQMRRCAISIPSNIAEGCSRDSSKETLRFINIALASATELETQLEICKLLGYPIHQKTIFQIQKTRQLLIGLTRYFKNKHT